MRTKVRAQPGVTDVSEAEGTDPPSAMDVEQTGPASPTSYADAVRRFKPKPKPKSGPSGLKALNRTRVPRSAAVAVRAVRAGTTIEEVLSRAKAEVSLADLGIQESRVRRTANGNLLIEVHDPEGAEKADRLAASLRNVFGDEVVVSRPSVKCELRLVGVDVTTSPADIRQALANPGEDLDSIKIGPRRTIRNGLGMVWVQCPIATAERSIRAGKIRIG